MKIAVEDVLASISQNQTEYFHSSLQSPLKIVKKVWRPYSRVYRIAADTGTGRRYFWLKMFKVPKNFQKMADKYLARLQTEFDIATQLQRAFADSPRINVVEPLAVFPNFGAVATWESKGKPLSDLIDKYGRRWSPQKYDQRLLNYAFQSGQALARLQEFTMTCERFPPEEIIEYVDIRLQRLVKNSRAPFAEKERKMVLNFSEKMIPKITDEECHICGVHSDFCAFNVLAHDEIITLTDFTSYKLGSTYVDLTYFYHRLAGFLHKPVFREPFISALQQQFLAGYGNADITGRPMFILSLLRHTINNFSSLARNRRGGLGKIPLPHVRLFNRRIFANYRKWLQETCG